VPHESNQKSSRRLFGFCKARTGARRRFPPPTCANLLCSRQSSWWPRTPPKFCEAKSELPSIEVHLTLFLRKINRPSFAERAGGRAPNGFVLGDCWASKTPNRLRVSRAGQETQPLARLAILYYMKSLMATRVIRKKRRRPATGQHAVTSIRLPAKLRRAVDAWAKAQPSKPSRSEAIRLLLELGLSTEEVR
jgi:hypothetical protein